MLEIVADSVSAFVFRRERGRLRLLLLRRTPDRGGFWQSVSGRLLKRETAEDAAGRGIAGRLRILARNSDPDVRAGAVRAASDPRRAGFEDLLLAALDDDDAEVRCAAIERGTVSALPRRLDDEAPGVRIASAAALLRYGERAAVGRAAREEEHEWVRLRIESALRETK